MNCRQVRDAIPLYVGADLPDAERARVDEHIAECAACRAQVDGASTVFAPLRGLGPVDAPVPEADLLWAGVARRMGWSDRSAAHPRAPGRRLRWIAKLAAVFVLGLGLGFGTTFLPRPAPLPQPDWSSPRENVAVAPSAGSLPAGTLPFAYDDVQPVDTVSGSRRFLLWNVHPQSPAIENRTRRPAPAATRFVLEQIHSTDHTELVAGY